MDVFTSIISFIFDFIGQLMDVTLPLPVELTFGELVIGSTVVVILIRLLPRIFDLGNGAIADSYKGNDLIKKNTYNRGNRGE